LKDSKAYIKGHLRNLKELIPNCIIPRERREAIREERSLRSQSRGNDRREAFQEDTIAAKIPNNGKLKKTSLRRNRTRSRNYQDEGSHEPSGIQEP